MSSEYARALGVRLRQIRAQQALSLHGVEQRSDGLWKAVVVGSYERGDRAISVHKLADLAGFYGVPVEQLLPRSREAVSSSSPPKIVIDLVRLGAVGLPTAAPLQRYVATIQALRGDYNGKVLTLRQDDLRSIAIIYDDTPENMLERLAAWRVLLASARDSGDNEDSEAAT